MILTELETLAVTIGDATAIPCYPLPGAGAQARRAVLYPPAFEWPNGMADADPWNRADWTVPLALHAAGSDPAQLRQLYDDLEAVLAAIPRPWRVTAVAPAVDAQGGTPVYTLTLER